MGNKYATLFLNFEDRLKDKSFENHQLSRTQESLHVLLKVFGNL